MTSSQISLKSMLKQNNSVGPWLQRGSEWLVSTTRILGETGRGWQARLFDELKVEHDLPLTVPQQWDAVYRNSRDVIAGLPEPTGAPVLFMTVWGGGTSPILSALESILAVSLRLRGVDTVSMMCDRTLPACLAEAAGNHVLPIPKEFQGLGTVTKNFTAARCRGCIHSVRSYFAGSPVTLDRFSQYSRHDDLTRATALVDGLDPAGYADATYRDINVGEHAHASVLRVLGRGTLLDDPFHTWLVQRHLVAAIMLVDLTERVLEKYQPRRIVAPHGIYVDHGTICETARKHDVPVAVFSFSYRRDTIMITHRDTYHRALVVEPNSLWDGLTLSPDQDAQLSAYVDSKRTGSQDNLTYHPNPIDEKAALFDSLGLDRERPIISMFTNVMWDAQVYHAYNAFKNLLDWVFETIRYFEKHPDLQLVIRVHPAETKAFKESKQKVAEEIAAQFPALPDNVKIIGPDNDLSSYSLVDVSHAALIYGTKMGLEIALRGVPVIIAGESMHRGKGFTYDVSSADEYFALLDGITDLPRNSDAMMDRARKYGYHFYFRRQIDFPFLTGFKRNASHELKLTFDRLDVLLPGQDANLDVLCDGLSNGTEFVADDSSPR